MAMVVANPSKSVASAFVSNAVCVSVEIILSASVVFSTFPNPTIAAVIPPTVPVNVGEAIFAFSFNTDTSAFVAKASVMAMVVANPSKSAASAFASNASVSTKTTHALPFQICKPGMVASVI